MNSEESIGRQRHEHDFARGCFAPLKELRVRAARSLQAHVAPPANCQRPVATLEADASESATDDGQGFVQNRGPVRQQEGVDRG